MSFSDPIVIISTATLIIQLIVLFLLAYGYSLKRNLQFRRHGKTMAAAVIIHALSIFLVMIPSLIIITAPGHVLPEPRDLVYVASIVHGIAGAIAFGLGVYLVAAWRFSKDVKACSLRKKLMRPTLAAWITALVLGIVLYVVFYGAALFS
jgi:uncharacterized membrane protein YozB (DUF420 family)